MKTGMHEGDSIAIRSRFQGWKQFRRSRTARWSVYFIAALIFFAVFADLLANNKPLYCRYNSTSFFPAFRDYAVELHLASPSLTIDWKEINPKPAVWPPVRYLPRDLDFDNAQYVSPFAPQQVRSAGWRHWLGTNALGQDVLAGMIHGTRIALLVAVFSMSIAAFIGIFLGGVAGFFGDRGIKVPDNFLILGIPFLLLAFFYGFQCRAYAISDALNTSFARLLGELLFSLLIFTLIFGIGVLISRFLPSLTRKRQLSFPADIIISRFIEVFNTIPPLLLVFSLIVLIKPSLFLVIGVIGITSWTDIARFIRAEMLRLREMAFIESARALGLPRWRIALNHALPNALPPVLIILSFGMAASILTESSLSFLGIGVPVDILSWGKLLASAREAPQAWWLAVFPGLAIFLTVTSLNLIGEAISEVLDPRLRRS